MRVLCVSEDLEVVRAAREAAGVARFGVLSSVETFDGRADVIVLAPATAALVARVRAAGTAEIVAVTTEVGAFEELVSHGASDVVLGTGGLVARVRLAIARAARQTELTTRSEARMADAVTSLRRSEETLRAFFDSAPFVMGTVALEPDGSQRLLTANETLARVLAGSPSSLEGKLLGDVGLAEVPAGMWAARYREARRRGQPVSFEAPIPESLGTGWVRCTVAALPHRPSEPDRYCFVVEQITQRKRDEALFSAEKEILERIAQGADLDASLSLVCSRIEALLPGAHAEVTLGAAKPAPATGRWAEPIVAKGGEVLGSVVVEMIGVDAWHRAVVERVATIAAIAVERQRNEEALRSQSHLVERITGASPMMLYLFDLPLGRNVYVNGEVKHVLGRAPAEFLAMTLEETVGIIHPDDLQRLAVELAPRKFALGDGDVLEFDFRMKHADGQWRWLSSREVVFSRDAMGHPRQFLGASIDVTERKRLEQQVLVTDRMASMGTLAAGIAHEINNPLAYVLGNLEILGRAFADPDGQLDVELLTRLTEDAIEGAQRVREIVRDLKVFSRPDDVRVGPTDVRRVIESAVRMASNELRHRAELDLDLAPVPLVAASDARLGQVFVNLLVNAMQSLDERAASRHRIRLRTRVGPPGFVLAEVHDTGQGIRPEVLPHIFDPFFTTKPVGVGTGLGLSVVHGIVTGLGGKIEVQSELGFGTVFRLLLPVARALEATPVTPAQGSQRIARYRARVLVIDDDAMLGAFIARVLSASHEVVSVTSGAEALRRVQDEHFDCVLCDVLMPGMSGIEVDTELARIAPELRARTGFLTGGAFTDAARDFVRSKGTAVLEKPFSLEALEALVARLLKSREGQLRSRAG